MNLSGPAITFLVFMLYGTLHSVLASSWIKHRVSVLLGAFGDRGYRLAYNLIAGITFIPVLAMPAVFPGEVLYRFDGPWLFMTSLLQLLGAAIILVGMLQTDVWDFLGLRQLAGNSPPTKHRLVVSGLYRYMRHPLYSGGLLLIWFLPMMTTSLLAFNLAASLYLYIGSRFEERRLIAAFGQAYQLYQQQVPRFLPRPGRTFNP
ncbi:MAG: isoprenylcysteine carboxylmethyltransferase family protein [Anaerolineales bacterium]|nr:MAG: isoprenylcysteine carboxylmethyltransferase family protein [Anaerolineales bacterium]